jgi:cobalamin biosynthesis Mg chelatase CobN
MSRNGSGTYTLPAGNPVVTGTTISSTWANSTLTNIASALTDSLAADGQTTATGNLKMGNNRITGLADGIASTDAATVSQVNASVAGLGTMSTQNANAVAITGGTVNGTSVGATTASTGAFTNFTASGTASFTSTGAVKVPVGTTAQQPSPVTGMIRFNSTTSLYEGYGTSAWGALGGGATGGGSDQIFNLNGQNVTTSYSIPSGKNASSAGPITIDTGATVTIPTGSVWVIV